MTPQPHSRSTYQSVSAHPAFASSSLVLGCIIFGMGSLIVAHLPIGPYSMAFWRLLVAGVIFIVLAQVWGLKYPRSKHAISFALLSGVFLGIDLALWHESIYAVGPGISTLLNSLQIFFLAAIGYWFFAERQTKLQLFSLLLAICGVALIANPELQHNIDAGWGFTSGIISGAMLAASMSCIRKAHQTEQIPIIPLMALISLGGCMVMLLPMLMFDSDRMIPTSWSQLGWILVYGAVMQCFAWGLIAYSIPKISLSLTGLLLLSEPIAALLIDYFWLIKPINSMQWIGATLTGVAIFLGSWRVQSK